MKIVVGLGNPGQEYSATRHNVGFMTVDTLAARWGVTAWRNKFDALAAEYRGKEPVLLLKPQTYMNLSGYSVSAAVKWYKVLPNDIVVIYDDLDLPAGKLRLRARGGPGGHRGMESLLVHLGTDEFPRIRVGIGRPPDYMETAHYVTGRFSPEEQPLMAEAIKQAAEAVEAILENGVAQAANKYSK
ncbi:MAG TPA: aminoacyl-tRNA hydrolase [Selenomonadales bacterium]|nr:aminoacyl-tRNA hydrolase [Selenomonadales bacterium]